MTVTLDWIHVATLVAGVQGFFLAAILAVHRSNRTANRLLAALIATFSIYLIQEVYYSAGLVRAYPYLFGISYPLPWVFGPLVYLYAVAASDRTWRFRARTALHFVPALLVVIAGSPIYLMSGPEKAALLERLATYDPPLLIKLMDPTKFISGLSYSAVTVAYLWHHQRRIRDSYSTTGRVNLLWLLWLSGGAAAIWLLALVVELAGLLPLSIRDDHDTVVSLAIALMVYAIGYMGLRQPEIFRYDGPVSPTRPKTAEHPVRVVVAEPPAAPVERYERSGLSDDEAGELRAALLDLMERERPYRDPDLTLPDLAARLDTTPHKLSEVLNAELSQTFYDFVNSYRVDDVRQRLARSESKSVSLLTLAMDAGFASKSTFNQVFKKQTGQTPSMYRKAASEATA